MRWLLATSKLIMGPALLFSSTGRPIDISVLDLIPFVTTYRLTRWGMAEVPWPHCID